MDEVVYNILWIDDEHEQLSGTKGRAKRNGITLIPFKSLDGGISELERNYPNYDGVLLDAKFFENETDEAGSEDTYASFRAKERILQLPKKFEIFVLTGQAEAYENNTFKKAFTKVYEKGKDEDINRLFEDIKGAARSQVDTQLRHSYKRVFDVCTERYIGELAGQDLLSLLKVNDEASIDVDLNAIRKVVEDLIIAFHKYNLLPIEFVNPTVFLNESSRFLAGKATDGTLFTEKGFQHLEGTHLPQQVASYLRSILSITQAGSHRSSVDKHVKSVRTPYLFKSVLFQLLDILVWFKMYVDGSPKTENWHKLVTEEVVAVYEPPELVPGTVINYIPEKGFAFFKPDSGGENTFIPPHIVSSCGLANGQSINVEIEEYADNRSGETKARVKKITL